MAVPGDYTGGRFGKLIILGDAPAAIKYGNRMRQVFVRCDCGKEFINLLLPIQSGAKQSCGCMRIGPKLDKRKPAVGNKYGRLLVTEELPGSPRKNGASRRRVRAVCDCGTVKEFDLSKLMTGYTKSCGCLMPEASAKNSRKHGDAARDENERQAPEYVAWVSIKQRCYNPKLKNFHLWGGRGITMCDRWFNDYTAFLADMGPRPSPKHSVDRRETDGNYEPNNCRWATRKEQGRNIRTNRMITVKGETICLAEWAERSGISADVISCRLDAGWCSECAVSLAKYKSCLHRERKQHPSIGVLTIDNETKSIQDWAKDYKIKHGTVRARLRSGWCAKCAVMQPLAGDCEHLNHAAPANHVRLTVNGRTDTLQEWSKTSGMRPSLLRTRRVAGWCDDCIVTVPLGGTCSHIAAKVHPSAIHVTVDGKTATLHEWSKQYSLKQNTIVARMARGWCGPCAVTLPIGQRCPHKPTA